MSPASSYDFHLVPQHVHEGTCTPTLFKVVRDKSNIPCSNIAEYSYLQCHNYYNWAGAVRVPACLQYANKLTKMMSEHVKSKLELTEQFKCSLYYL